MYKPLGLINMILIVVITSPYWLRHLGRWLFPGKKIASSRPFKALRAIHKPLGVCLLLSALAHGYLALGALRLHTGVLAGIAILAAVVLGILFYGTKKVRIFKWHKRAAFLVVLLTLLHLFVPNALYRIFG